MAEPDDPLFLIYTSGTTGKPKGALLTHANCFWTNLSFDLATGVRADDVVLQVLPQFHCGGWNVQSILAWWKGAPVVLERGFDAARALELIECRAITTMMGVPANYLFMAQEPRFADADLSTLRLAVVGGAPMPEALLDTWAARGVEIVQGYGLTEAAPNVLCLPPEDARRKAGWAGKPYPYVECDLSDEGELLVRGPERLPRLLAQRRRDGGRVPRRLAAHRRRRRARRRGPLPHPRPAQGHVRLRRRERLPGRDRGRPARASRSRRRRRRRRPRRALGRGGRRVRRPAAPVSDDELRALPASQLARFKVPKSFRFVDELPRNSMGKILKSELEGHSMTESSRSRRRTARRPLSKRGLDTRRRLLDAAERVFGDLGYHDASIVKLAEAAGVAAGTFYLYFDSKKAIFDELVRDLNRRVRHAMKEGSSQGRRGSSRSSSASTPTSASPPSIRRSTGSSARRSSSRPRCSATTTTGSRRATSRRCRQRSDAGEVGAARPGGRRPTR